MSSDDSCSSGLVAASLWHWHSLPSLWKVIQLQGSPSKFLTCINLFLPTPATTPSQSTLMQHRWQPWFIIITYLVCFSFNSSTEQDRFSPMRYPAQATGQRNKFWGLAFTCRELLQPCNTIPFYWTSGPENQNSTPRFKMIATTDTIIHLSFQDWVN